MNAAYIKYFVQENIMHSQETEKVIVMIARSTHERIKNVTVIDQ